MIEARGCRSKMLIGAQTAVRDERVRHTPVQSICRWRHADEADQLDSFWAVLERMLDMHLGDTLDCMQIK